jgi:hypothetical protein
MVAGGRGRLPYRRTQSKAWCYSIPGNFVKPD